jgi:hypothetical protein
MASTPKKHAATIDKATKDCKRKRANLFIISSVQNCAGKANYKPVSIKPRDVGAINHHLAVDAID